MTRKAYALEQFVAQVLDLYPDAEVEFGDADGLDVIREARFDAATSKTLVKLQGLVDQRISATDSFKGELMVRFSALSPLADDRTPFELPAPAVEEPAEGAGEKTRRTGGARQRSGSGPGSGGAT